MSRTTTNVDTYKLLTDKQLDALNLLVKHKTSKEISRELGISPHTVDQRIEAAKRRLGVATRGELVRVYLQLKRQCHELTYEESHIDVFTEPKQFLLSEPHDASSLIVDPQRVDSSSRDEEVGAYRVGPELFEGRYGTLFRFFAIVGMAVALLIIILATTSIYVNLSDIVKK